MQAIGLILAEIGWAIAGLGVGGYTAVAIGAAVVVGGSIAAAKAMGLFEIEMPQMDSDASRQTTVKTTVAPQKIIYGEALVSGPISYIALAGSSNSDLYQTIVLAGHKVNAITDVHFDDEIIQSSWIAAGLNNGSNTAGNVTAGTFGPIDSNTICVINKHLGAASQAADPMLEDKFDLYTTAHRGEGIAYLAMKWTLDEDSAEVWEKYSPGNVKALVQGKQVYDPRLEVTAGGTAGANPTTAAYVAYSTNPALCVTDYLIDQTLGMGIAASKIDWAAVITAANGCDVDVDVPNSATQKRFTANGVLFGTDSHQKNINKLLSAMNGRLIYSNGKYIVKAGIYEAPTEVLTEDDLIGAIQIKTSLERSDRFNTIRGIFVDASANNKSTEFPKVQLADAVNRDNGEVLEKEIQLPMVSDSYQAQRIANKLIQLSDQQKIISFPANLSALRITAGDRVQVTVEELSWNQKVFECIGWTFSDEGGVNLTLREDSSLSYGDPLPAAYSQISSDGVIADGFRGVPSPSGLSATAGLKNNVLNWVNPGKPSDFGTVYVYASPNGNFSSAVKIGETDGTQFTHDASTAADAVAPGDLRYYWVRAIKNVGTDAAARSNLEPNADPNTTVFATVGRVNWADVSGTTGAPQSNATVGAQISVNLFDADGSSVMSAADVKNSVLAQEILEVEVEAGEVLNLETGADVDIQNLGDVAIFVSDSNVTLNNSINTVASNLSQLEDAVIDLTSGVSDIYIQATAPVAGVGGIPNPIPQFSRWYDSDDGNAPYYWDGSAWVSFKDADIADNKVNITNLTANLATTDGNVTANSSAISALDTLTIAQGGSITSLSGSVTALQSTVNNASTGVTANASGLSSLTTRVTSTENATTVNSNNITTLTSDLDQAELDIAAKASSTALTALTTRVTAAEGTVISQSADITALESTVDNGTTGVAANASGLTALTTRVTNTEDATTVNSGAVTTLNATYTEDLHFRTEAEDENDNLIDLETGSGTVQLQDLTDFVSGSSAAIDSLTVQTFANEDGIQTQAIQLTALESTVNDPTNGVTATAGALSTLSTTVSVIDNQVSTTAQDLTTLTTTVGGNTASITTQSNSIDGVEANYGVKIDNNNRITGFGLLSTTAGSTPFSEFAVVADQFSIVSPDSTADTPIQPFTVTADKIYFGADVIVSGDLISTGTISADRLQIDGVMFDTETVGGVTSLVIKESGVNTSQIAESAITTARLSNDAVTVDKFANTLQSTNYVADTSGWQILTSGDVEFQNAKITGQITATSGSISNTVTVGGTAASTVASGAIAGASAIQDNDTGLTLGLQAGSAGPITISYTPAEGQDPEVAKLYQGTGTFNNSNTGFYLDNSGNFSLQDKLAFNGSTLAVDGEITSVSGTIGGFTLGSTRLTAGDGTTRISLSTADGIHLGDNTFASAPFRVSPAGALTASSATLTGNVTASSFTLAQGATLSDLDGAIANTQQLMAQVTGIIDANQHAIPSFWRITTDDALEPSNTEFNDIAGRLPKVNDLVITTDTTVTDPVTPDRTYGWTCTVAGVADPATEATWTAITNFMSGDLLVDGSVSADQINANSVASAIITAGSIIIENDLSDGATIISGSNILTGTIIADYIDVSGVIQAGALITDTATINNDIRIGSGESVFSADSAGIYLGNETFAEAEFSVTPEGVLTATGADISGAITATSLSLSEGITIGTTNLDTAVNTSLGLADSSNQDSTATILNGNLTGTVDDTAVADIKSGAAAGASAVQDSDTGLTLGLQAGSAGPVTISYTAAVGGNPEVAKLYQGDGTFNHSDTGFYLDNSGNFSLQDKLAFNGSTLAVDGDITATSLTLSEGITIAKSVVGLTNVDDVSQATIQSDTLTAATSSDVGLGDVENLDAQDQAQTGLIAGTTITGGGITMSAGGAIKTTGKDSESNTTNGFFLGYNGSNYTFGVGDANQSMQWTGSELNIVGALNATSLNVTSITGAVTGFDAGKISGDVTEVYPLSSTPNVMLDNSEDENPTIIASFSIPAPENAVSKRHRLSLAFEIQSRRSSGTGLDTHTIYYWASRKSLGFESVAIGASTYLTFIGSYVEIYTFAGNVTDQMDNNGAIAPNTNPSAAQIGKIIGVSYQAATNKTNVEVSFGSTASSPRYANGTTIYFSPSQFTASGVYPDSAWQGKQSLILDGTSYTYATVPLIASFGSTTVARDYRIYAQNSSQYTNLTVTCPKLYGTVENIA